MEKISKLIGEYGPYLLMSIKKCPGDHDGLLEFPGGRAESGEDAGTTLLRELMEEEPKGVLSKAVKDALQGGRSIQIFTLEKRKHCHTIFQVTLSDEEYRILSQESGKSGLVNSENYGPTFIDKKKLNPWGEEKNIWFSKEHPKLTPRTRKILKSLHKMRIIYAAN